MIKQQTKTDLLSTSDYTASKKKEVEKRISELERELNRLANQLSNLNEIERTIEKLIDLADNDYR